MIQCTNLELFLLGIDNNERMLFLSVELDVILVFVQLYFVKVFFDHYINRSSLYMYFVLAQIAIYWPFVGNMHIQNSCDQRGAFKKFVD